MMNVVVADVSYSTHCNLTGSFCCKSTAYRHDCSRFLVQKALVSIKKGIRLLRVSSDETIGVESKMATAIGFAENGTHGHPRAIR